MFSSLGKILVPLEWVVAWIMVHVHQGLSALGMSPASGWTWVLSIVGLVVVIRIILIPLFVKQIKASRGMTLLQPEMKKITAKYKGRTDPESRAAQQRETMELYKAHGTNPFASCLPILLQAPIFFALFRVLNNGIRNDHAVGPLTQHLAHQAGQSSIFGVHLIDTFRGTSGVAPKVLIALMIILMSVTTFTTQRQLMTKNMPASALDNPFAQQQKLIMYVYPVIFAVTGINFPLGQLVYWLATNLWTTGQQFYVIRRMPAPGSPAEKAMEARRARRATSSGSSGTVVGSASGGGSTSLSKGLPSPLGTTTDAEQAPRPRPSGQRVQPRRKGRGGPAGGSSAQRPGLSGSTRE